MHGGPGAFSGTRVEVEPRNAESDMQLAGLLKGCSESFIIPEGIVKVINIRITEERTQHAAKLGVFCVGRGNNQMWMSSLQTL